MANCAGKKRVSKKMPAKELYLGCFSFDRLGDPEWAGTFQLVVEASDPEQAVGRCRTRFS